MTVGRREGKPNITVIYDGEIIRGMTWEKISKGIAAEPGTCTGLAGSARDRRVRPADDGQAVYPWHAEHVAHATDGEGAIQVGFALRDHLVCRMVGESVAGGRWGRVGMWREPSLTFEGALRILGKHEHKTIERIDKLLGGVILGGGAVAGAIALGVTPLAPVAAFGIVWGWVDQKGLAR